MAVKGGWGEGWEAGRLGGWVKEAIAEWVESGGWRNGLKPADAGMG